MHVVLKFIITAGIVVAVSEIAKRSTLAGAIVVSLPLTSILTMIWIYHESKNIDKILGFSFSVFWMVIPSLAFFLLLPFFIRFGLSFYQALAAASMSMAVIYYLFGYILSIFGLRIF